MSVSPRPDPGAPAGPTSRLDVNVLANLLGQAAAAFAQLAFIPVYIRVLGIEGYGLVGFFTMLQGLLMVLDLGLSATINRELARRSARPEGAHDARDLVRTLEALYWGLGFAIGLALVIGAPVAAMRWVRPASVPADEVVFVLRIMGLAVALNWPITLYQGGLLGLQRQRTLNAIRASMSVVTAGGAAVVLLAVSPTLRAFFAWQIAAGAAYVAMLATALWRALPPSDHPPRVSAALARRTWRFAAGVGALTASGLVLSQLDKLVVSSRLDLATFGYYSLAAVLGNALYVLINPVHNALFPRFSALVAGERTDALRRVYHWGAQVMAVLILPAALVFSLFSFDAVLAWTGSVGTAARVAPILSLLALGTAINGIMHVPFGLQLAHGWTRHGLAINVVLIVAMVPGLVWAVGRFGAVGAAGTWLALNALYASIGVPLTHARVLRGEAGRFAADVLRPLLAALAAALLGRAAVPATASRASAVAVIVVVLAASAIAAALAAPQTRHWLRTRLMPDA